MRQMGAFSPVTWNDTGAIHLAVRWGVVLGEQHVG